DGFEDEPPPVQGRISFGGGSLTLEFDASPDTNAGPRKVVIGISEFADVRYRRGLVGDRLALRAATWGALGGVPGASMDRVVLRFARRDRAAAEQLTARLEQVLAERGRRADDPLRRAV